jgi:hypothetical protein
VYRLAVATDLGVILIDDELQDALHRQYGTGEWPVGDAPSLTDTDHAFAMNASHAGPLGYVERFADDEGYEVALLWRAGTLAMRPRRVSLADPGPSNLRPANLMLRALGVSPIAGLDEAATFGLDAWRTNADIAEGARRIT